MLNKHDAYVAAAITGLTGAVRPEIVTSPDSDQWAKRIARLAHDVAEAAMKEGARRNMERK